MAVLLDDYRATTPSVVALGTFDGVHLGHQALLNHAATQAKSHGWTSLAFVFSQPPGNYLGHPKPMLIPAALKYELLEQHVDQTVFAEFPQLAWMAPETFVKDVLCARLQVKGLVVGENYRFGKDRAGDVGSLKALGGQYGFDVYEVPGVEVAGDWVSSTRIRRAIRMGEIQSATRLLGHPPLLYGRVIRGEGRGQKLGYPTANLALSTTYVSPEQGIFSGVACLSHTLHSALSHTLHSAAIYIGTKPTFNGQERVVEVHLLDEVFPPLYDETLTVHLVEKIRDDQPFDDADTLKVQIKNDVERVRQTLTGGLNFIKTCQ